MALEKRLMTWRRAATAAFDESRWKAKPLNLDITEGRTGTHDVYSVQVPLVVGEARTATLERAADTLLRYRIFPPRRMLAHVCSPDGRVAVGTTVIQRVLLGPLALEMGVRVVEVLDESKGSRRVGFTYATLQGHSERGLATFSIHSQTGGCFVFKIETWSSPGNLLAALGRPFARRVQQKFTREALSHFRDHFHSHAQV
jgi:uncharacterized protein (UPF0548 family)